MTFEIKYGGDHISNHEAFSGIIWESKLHDKEPKVWVLHGRQAGDIGTGEYNLLIWAYPSNYPAISDRKRLSKVTLHGKEIEIPGDSGTGDYFLLEKGNILGSDTPILDDSGQVLAIKRDNTVWILFDVVHDRLCETLLPYILEQAYGKLGLAELREVRRQRLREMYLRGLKEEKKYAERAIQDSMQALADCERRYLGAIKDYAKAERSYADVLDALKDIEKSADEVIEKLIQLPGIQEIKSTGAYLQIITKPLYLGPVEIGSYKISFEPTAIRIFNDQVKRGKLQHPHVSEDGIPCWGNVKGVADYFYRGRWDLALQIIISYLQSYNGESPLLQIRSWIKEVFGPKSPQYEAYDKLVEENKAKDVIRIKGSSILFI